MTRQVYYSDIQSLKSSAKVIHLVNSKRILMPKIGTRKLYYLLKEDLQKLEICRDKLFTILTAIILSHNVYLSSVVLK